MQKMKEKIHQFISKDLWIKDISETELEIIYDKSQELRDTIQFKEKRYILIRYDRGSQYQTFEFKNEKQTLLFLKKDFSYEINTNNAEIAETLDFEGLKLFLKDKFNPIFYSIDNMQKNKMNLIFHDGKYDIINLTNNEKVYRNENLNQTKAFFIFTNYLESYSIEKNIEQQYKEQFG